MILKIFSKKYGEKEVLIDDEDWPRISGYSWHVNGKNGKLYVVTNIPGGKKQKKLKMHRVIMNCHENDIIDHKNGNVLDNRKENLRFCSAEQNNMNASKYRNGISSKYKGVSLHKINKRFVSYISYKKKRIYLGSFKEEIEAAKTYNKMATELFGEYAKLNVFLEDEC